MTDQLILQFSTTVDSLANWTSAVIRRMNHSPFSHVDFILPDGNCLGASDQGPKSPYLKGNPEGVAIRPPNYQEFGYRRQMILRTDKADDVIAWAMTQLGKPFDSSSLWGFISDEFPGTRDWTDPTAWFCAEYKACALQDRYWSYKLPWPKTRVSPTDLLLVNLMDERWINRETFWNPVPGLALGTHER